MSTKHIPVMVQEVVHFLRPGSGTYVDMTLGGGSMARAILEAAAPDARLIGIDCDDAAIGRAQQMLAAFGDRVTYVREDFRHLDSVLADLGIDDIATIVVTHIHIDHAGGAGQLARRYPNARIGVHHSGARHLVAPSRLWKSALTVFGEEWLTSTWGTMEPIPEERVVALEDGDVATVNASGVEICDADGQRLERPQALVPWDDDAAEKGGYETFMLKEIHEQPAALHETLALIAEEGLEARVKRHLRNGTALRAGLEAMGLKLFAQEACRSNSLTSVCIPEGVDDLRVRQRLLNEFSIEIGVGLGALKGKIWRIGLMGHSSSLENVLLILAVLEQLLADEGYKVEPGAGLSGASQILTPSTPK